MSQLTHAFSPLAQARRSSRVTTRRSRRQLSEQEQRYLKRLLEEKFEYMDSPVFHLPDDQAVTEVFDTPSPIPQPDISWYHPLMDSDTGARSYSHSQSGSVLLTAAQEQVLFNQYNYCRYRVCRLRDQLQEEAEVDVTLAREMLSWYDRAEQYREQIANINLALVLAMAKRTRMSEMDFADLVSEGNMALLRAIDKFDAGRGFKFSTYACRAILKAFSRAGIKLSKYRQMFPTEFVPEFERSNYMENRREEHEVDCADEIGRILTENRADLSDIEVEVIEHRFAIGRARRQDNEAKGLTLDQVGKIIGVTKERVRQIQNKALDKLRMNLEGDFLR